MRCAALLLVESTTVDLCSFFFLLCGLEVKLCRPNAWLRTIFPVPVFLRRLAAPLWVFNLGIEMFLDLLRKILIIARSFVCFLPLLVPGHLDGFELALGGLLRVVAEVGELGYPFMQVREADFEWIDVGKLVEEG